MQYIGCHLTITKGFTALGNEALKLGGNTAQFFTRNPRGGKAKDMDPADVDGRQLMEAHGFGPLIAHAPYTINPCAAKPETLDFARMTMADDLHRLYRYSRLFEHPGRHPFVYRGVFADGCGAVPCGGRKTALGGIYARLHQGLLFLFAGGRPAAVRAQFLPVV